MPIAPIIPWINNQFTDDDGLPLAGGKVWTYEAGTTTPLETYSEANLDPLSERTNPIILGADGRPTVGENIYLLPQMYKFVVMNANDVEVITRDDVGDRGYINTENAGIQQTEGSTTERTGTYDMVEDDRMIRFDTTGGNGTLNLLPAAEYGKELVIKNMGTGANTIAVTPDGSDTIEGIAAAFTIPAASSPTFPTLRLAPNEAGDGWWVTGSHGF